ncbi:MAG: hypothetical protein WCG94_02970 [Methanothrix sp.]
MTGIPERELSILLHSSRYNLAPFDSGDVELNDYLKNDALREQKEFLSKTHLCFYRDRVAGFISMAADSVQVKRDKLDPSQIIDECEYLAVDPKDGALKFYEKFGFRFWTKSTYPVFIAPADLAPLRTWANSSLKNGSQV